MTRTGPGRRVAPSGRLVREATSRGGVLVPAVVGDLDEPWPGRDVGPGPGPGTGRLGGTPPGYPRHLGLECWRGKRRRGRRQPLAPGACGSPVGGPPTCRPAVLPGSLAIFLGLDIFSRLGGCGGPAPHPAHDDDVVLLRQCRHAAPRGRFSQVADLRNDQFGEPFALQDRAGGQPGDHAWRQHVQPEQRVVEGKAEHSEQNHIRHGDRREDGYLADRYWHRQPEVVQLVEPLLDPPDARICGQIHLVLSFRSGRRFSGRRVRSRCPVRASEQCSGCRRSQRSRLRGR